MAEPPPQHDDAPPPVAPIGPPPAVDAVVRDGVIVPLEPLGLPEGTPLRAYLTLRVGGARAEPPPAAPAATPARRRWDAGAWAAQARDSLALPLGARGVPALLTRWDALLLALGMLVYTLVRFVGLLDWPIFFFCDEAIHTNQALALLERGLVDEQGVFLPPYFRNVEKYNLSLSVYLQGISAILFGKSAFVNRATSAGVTLLAGVAVALMLRLIYQRRSWWAGPLILAALPVWFLHSRTSFETVLMVSFYACFLCSYLLYRYHDPRWLVAAIVFGGATFYSYANGQGVMAVSGVLLLLSDLPYHWRTLRDRPRLLGAALLAGALVAAQYVRFRLLYPDAISEHLRVMNSIWLRDVPLADKLADFGKNYVEGLSPAYWFMPNNGVDLERHTFKDWGNLPTIFLPLVLVGLGVCLREWRSSAHRLILIAILAAPFSASLAFIHNYRVLSMVIPAALLAAIGLDRLLGWLGGARWLSVAAAALLVAMNLMMLRAALVDGPTWYTEYGLYGMQYGSSQVFGAISEELSASDEALVIVSPDWANNPNEFVPFFLPDPQRGRVQFRSPTEYLARRLEIPPGALFVLPAADYEKVSASQKFALEQPARVIPYPNGRPGFYFVRMRYAEGADAIFAAEREERRRLIDDVAVIDGQQVQVRRSQTDLGAMADLFDGDPDTVLRGIEANPFVLELTFPEPRSVSALQINGWQPNIELRATVTLAGGGEPLVFSQRFEGLPNDPLIDLPMPGGPYQVRALRIEITDTAAAEVSKIHIRGLTIRP